MSRTRFQLAAHPHTLRRFACIAGLAMTLTACGYKGPLYMPPPPPAPEKSLTTPPSDETIPSVGSPASAPVTEEAAPAEKQSAEQ